MGRLTLSNKSPILPTPSPPPKGGRVLSPRSDLYNYPSRESDEKCNIFCFTIRKTVFLGMLCLFCLIVALTSERVLFKITVDRLIPFRFVLIQEIVLFYLTVTFTVVSMKRMFTHDITAAMYTFPRNSLMVMSALDLIQLTMTVMSAAQTTPMMTVILLQAIKGFSILASCLAGRALKYQRTHYLGAFLILFAVALAVFPAIYRIVSPMIAPQSWNVLVYFLSGIPAALSSLYKEHSLIKFAQPMDPYYLNMYLGLYQFLLILLASPLCYKFQSLGHSWSFYPQASFSSALNDGWACAFWGTQYDTTKDELPQEGQCSYSFFLVAGYVASTVLVNVFIDQSLIYTRERSMYRAVTMSIVVACIILGLYTKTTNGEYYPATIPMSDIISLVLLAVGLEVYHREKEPDSDFLTQWTGRQQPPTGPIANTESHPSLASSNLNI
mmetsp:Transcript_23799/g.31116  ORF Transcript_23799/g.31116 Transcript_23799/m.31116 type:complete len:440 (+) Transcript_23799:231-1550(+)